MEQRIKVGYAEYWRGKFERNIARDDYVTSTLRQNGWLVVRLWESDVRRDIDRAAALVRRAVSKRRVKTARKNRSSVVGVRIVLPEQRHAKKLRDSFS
jgi:DNA mismatch endonuclease (patch repair protein)